MFGNLKKKLSNAIQEGFVISKNLQEQYRERISSIPSTPTTSTGTLFENSISTSSHSSLLLSQLDLGVPTQLNFAAGCNLLAKYEEDWKKIHIANEENAAQAAKIATHIAEINKQASAQRLALTDLITCLSGIPTLVSQLNAAAQTVQQIELLGAQIEDELKQLEELCEECELQEFMLEKQCALSQHKQKKMLELEHYRQKVAAEHQTKIREHEESLRKIQRERQAVFADAFWGDMNEYKQKGMLATIQQERNNKLSLEEVVLDDNEAKDALEEFLNK